MQLTALSRKSAVVALVVLAVMIFAAMNRRLLVTFQMEHANGGVPLTVATLIFAGVILFAGGVIVGRSHIRSGLTNGFSGLSMPLFAIISCGVFVAADILMASITALCFSLAIFLLLRSLRSPDEKDSIFFAAMLLGVMVLLYPPTIVLFLMLPLLVFILVLSMRQVVMLLVAYFMPFLTVSYIKWYMGYDFGLVGLDVITDIKMPQMGAITELPIIAVAMGSLVLFMLLAGALHSFFRGNKMIRMARDRRAVHLFIWMSIVSLAMLLIPGCDLAILPIIAVPLSVLLAFILGFLPDNLSTIAYWVLVALFVLHLFMA